ncbi:hypothetical protein Nepgr_018956 [Nepenthes gracilis]|uniref:VQ domain-containing protein n=1 Tax=Nepenthes gracilis TaxID=150966 RepID=A0AAD3XUS2_NEPGR|nr:hypothetical protein Nepgr_018956 [Nepenthes gracilis]
MKDSDTPGGRPRPKELLGPRPAQLKVRTGSFKLRKPPAGPSRPPQHQPQQQPRPPVIIYTVSPKVIHTDPANFMTLVQRLTGSKSKSASSSTGRSSSWGDSTGANISPAARFASIEKTRVSPESKKAPKVDDLMGFYDPGLEMGSRAEIPGHFPGILSPGPRFLPPISPNLFPPLMEPSSLALYHDLNAAQVQLGTSSFIATPTANSFSPSTVMFSPSSLDLLNNFLNGKDDRNLGF